MCKCLLQSKHYYRVYKYITARNFNEIWIKFEIKNIVESNLLINVMINERIINENNKTSFFIKPYQLERHLKFYCMYGSLKRNVYGL